VTVSEVSIFWVSLGRSRPGGRRSSALMKSVSDGGRPLRQPLDQGKSVAGAHAISAGGAVRQGWGHCREGCLSGGARGSQGGWPGPKNKPVP